MAILATRRKMAGDQLVRGFAVAMLFPALGQHVFFVRLQHRKLADFLQIAWRPASPEAIAGNDVVLSHCSIPFLFPEFPGRVRDNID